MRRARSSRRIRPATLKITVTCINIDAKQGRDGEVERHPQRHGAHSRSTVTLPTALAVANTQLILAKSSYAYTPTVGYTITGTINLSDKMYMSPRITAPTYGTTACT